jgi:hypothetical protein
VLTLKIVAPVSTVAGTEILQLPVSNSAVSHAEVELVRQDVDVKITGGLLLDHSALPYGSRWVAYALMNAPSQNVFNLQRRVAGVLPVRIDVPKAGKSYRFVRPLVLDEQTQVMFQYKTR